MKRNRDTSFTVQLLSKLQGTKWILFICFFKDESKRLNFNETNEIKEQQCNIEIHIYGSFKYICVQKFSLKKKQKKRKTPCIFYCLFAKLVILSLLDCWDRRSGHQSSAYRWKNPNNIHTLMGEVLFTETFPSFQFPRIKRTSTLSADPRTLHCFVTIYKKLCTKVRMLCITHISWSFECYPHSVTTLELR